jgi:hypothetical protein
VLALGSGCYAQHRADDERLALDASASYDSGASTVHDARSAHDAELASPDAAPSHDAGTPRLDAGAACDDGIACTDDVQDFFFGCTHSPRADRCDDGVACTIDACDAAVGCTHALDPARCDDGVACTIDSCDATLGCLSVSNDALCDDGVACTIDSCDAALGCNSTPDDTFCASATECGSHHCDAALDCTFEPSDADCDDLIACTKDSCLADGLCEHQGIDALCAAGESCRSDCGGCILDIAPSGYFLAHGSQALFRVRPQDGHTLNVGSFGTTLTDIALDADGQLWGISFGQVFRVDFCTAQIELVTQVPTNVNGLTWTSDGLYATALDGSVLHVSTEDASMISVTTVGTLGQWGSSGDVVATLDGALLVTVPTVDGDDGLVRYDLATGIATFIGRTGQWALYGLSLFGDRLIAAQANGQLYELDPQSAEASPLGHAMREIWGAAAAPADASATTPTP